MIKRCKHREYWSTKGMFRGDEIGLSCMECGKPKKYPIDLSYRRYLSGVSILMITAWLKIGDAIDIFDVDAFYRFFNSLFASISAVLAILIMPFLFPLYPLIALFSMLNHRRKLKGRIKNYFEAFKDD